MNAPFKPPLISEVHGQATVSITALKTNPAAVVAEAQERAVAILNRNKAVAYVISPEIWAYLNDALEDLDDIRQVSERLADPKTPVAVSIDDLV